MIADYNPARCAAITPVGASPYDRMARQCVNRRKDGSLLCGQHQLAAVRRQRAPVMIVPGAPEPWEANVERLPAGEQE